MFIPDPNFFIPDPGLKRYRIPDPDPQQRIVVFLTKKMALSFCKYDLGCWDLGARIQDPDFFPSRIPDPGV
jgi:hypothetical protein